MLREVYLQPGELYFGAGPIRLSTLLGSCVSVTLWHAARRLGGMCHVMLPSRSRGRAMPWDGRYADEALALFRKEINATGTRPGEYQVAVFGGGNMFPNTPNSNLDVGQRNIRAVRSLLPQHGFAIDWEDVGGVGYRRLWLDLRTGDVRCVQVNGDSQRIAQSVP